MNDRNEDIRNSPAIPRRRFLKTAAASAVAVTSVGGMRGAAAREQAAPAKSEQTAASRPFVGIQIAAHSFFDEGVDYCLDLLQETAGVNALLVSVTNYYGAMSRPQQVMADHGVPRRDGTGRRLQKVWLEFHDKYYAGTSIKHAKPDPDAEYADRDLLKELVEPARRRGMKVLVRWYQPGGKAREDIANWEQCYGVDLHGERTKRVCWNHPEYRHGFTSQDIYDAVLEDRASDLAQFRDYLESEKGISIAESV